jgi:hypothetical protein
MNRVRWEKTVQGGTISKERRFIIAKGPYTYRLFDRLTTGEYIEDTLARAKERAEIIIERSSATEAVEP